MTQVPSAQPLVPHGDIARGGWCGSNHFVVCVGERFAVDDGIESINGVGGVLDSATEAIGIIQRVFALHHIAVTGFHLALGVARHSILYVIGKVVFGMRIIGINLMGMGVGMTVTVNVVRILVNHMLLLRSCSMVQLWLMMFMMLHRD